MPSTGATLAPVDGNKKPQQVNSHSDAPPLTNMQLLLIGLVQVRFLRNEQIVQFNSLPKEFAVVDFPFKTTS